MRYETWRCRAERGVMNDDEDGRALSTRSGEQAA